MKNEGPHFHRVCWCHQSWHFYTVEEHLQTHATKVNLAWCSDKFCQTKVEDQRTRDWETVHADIWRLRNKSQITLINVKKGNNVKTSFKKYIYSFNDLFF